MNKPETKLTESKLQRACEEFVRREVIYCVSSLIYELAQNEKLQQDLWDENILSRPTYYGECPDCEKYTDGILDKDLERGWFACPCGSRFQPDEEIEEAYEHWIVTSWLANKLEDKGEMVTKDFLGLTIWGRTCTGQSIMLDEVIRDIYQESK